MHRFTRFLVLLIVLLLALSPVMAQDDLFQTNTPEGGGVETVADATVEATAPVVVDPPDDVLIPADLAQDLYLTAMSQFTYVLVIVVGLGSVVLLGVSVPAFYYIYKSTPALFQPALKEAAVGVLTAVEGRLQSQYEASKTNDVDWDDDIWLSLFKEAKKRREEIAGVGARDKPQVVAE